jgi:histidinol phosphatase-like enzyme (inositol monophosphatase family)
MAFEHDAALAAQLAQEAGEIALDFQRKGVSTEWKADESPVTAADRACERLIVERLEKEFPEDGVLGEEGANRESRNGRKWIIDPIDGTKDFVRGIPLWAVLIGLEQDGEIVAGAAYSPGQRLLLSASRGGGTWANGAQIHVSNISEPDKAILAFNGFNKVGVKSYAVSLLDWVGKFWAVRGLGGSVDAMMVAQGKADVWIEPNAAPWDLAPLKIIVEEAGGKFASFSGKNTIYGGNAYACVPGLEGYVQTLLRQ